MDLNLSKKFQGSFKLLRIIAVFSSSIATIFSSLLPLYLYYPVNKGILLLLFLLLSLAAVIFHGVLVHLFNDYVDHLTGTDGKSPAVLSGGSRVIQEGYSSPETIWNLGKWLAILLLLLAVVLGIFGLYVLTILIFIGVWAAVSYSLPPLRLSYHPFLGEWLSLFPALFFLGIAGPWLLLNEIPIWAYQNSLINTLACMVWVMVHHIPDIEADRQAVPKKRTTIVWFTERFGNDGGKMPALIYISIASMFLVWVAMERLNTAIIVAGLLASAFLLVGRMNVECLPEVTNVEKILLGIAVLVAVILGVWI